MRKWVVRLFVLIVFMLVIADCGKSSDSSEKVKVYKMVSFSVEKENSVITFTDSKAIKSFRDGFNNAKRVQGIVDTANPEYKVELGDKTYFLWIRQESGTIMNDEDSHHVYTLSKSSANAIYKLLK